MERVEAARAYAEQENEHYQKQIESKRTECNQKLDGLNAEAKNIVKEANAEVEKQIKDPQKKGKAVLRS